jgi:Uma2 family endonuclease
MLPGSSFSSFHWDRQQLDDRIASAMTIAIAQSRFTPDDVLRLEDEGLFELVGGKLVEKVMSSLASETAGIITARLVNYRDQTGAGKVYPEQTFQCFPNDPDLIRRPDVAFIVTDRLAQVAEEGHVTIAPDLAVEVISPNDKIYDLEEKLEDYWSAGVKLVWAVNPKFRWIRIHRPDRSVMERHEADTLTGESVLPGLSVAVGDLLPK